MNELPEWDYRLLDPVAYYNDVDRVVPYVSSYGCPHACSYCAEPAHSGRHFRALGASRVAHEVLALHERYEPELVDFMDPNFSTDPRRVVRFVEAIEELGGTARFSCNMRARDVVMLRRSIDLERLAAAGFARIFIGVESGSDRLLAELRKNATVAHTVEACEALSWAGIETYTSFMHDLPTETNTDSEASLALAERLAALPGNLQAHQFYMPFPGTELFAARFADRIDSEAPQRTWASASTKGAPQLWPGRPEFRRRVVDRLTRLQDARSEVFALTRLPHA